MNNRNITHHSPLAAHIKKNASSWFFNSLLMVDQYFTGLSRSERVRAARKISVYALGLCVFTLLVGHWILELFGLSVPIIQLGGGIMICKIGWEFLTTDKPTDSPEPVPPGPGDTEFSQLEGKLFYPITFPITTGAGTIAVLFTLSAHVQEKTFSGYLLNNAALLISILAICILIFIFYVNAGRLIKYMGSHNEKIVNRLMAFLIFCVGLQIAVGGITNLIHR
jgi:multiple antibiotic resistance protein